MKLFSRGDGKFPEAAAIQLGDSWSVLHGQSGEHAFVGMSRARARSLAGHPSYPNRATIGIPVHSPREDGFPTPEESAEIYALEDTIQDLLEAANQSLLVAKWFINGYRELVFYTSDQDALRSCLEAIDDKGTTHAMQLHVESDPDWDLFRAIAAA